MNQTEKRSRGIFFAVFLPLMILLALAIGQGQSPNGMSEIPVGGVGLPLQWPLPLPLAAQVQQARDCDIEALASERYPGTVSAGDLADAFTPRSACDWAVLAVAYAARTPEGQPPPSEGRTAFVKSAVLNPAYPLKTLLLFSYFGMPGFVEAPPQAEQPITEVAINYTWTGGGDPVAYELTITGADNAPVVAGVVNGAPFEATLPVETVQALGPALTNLVPIENPLMLVLCADNFPDWEMGLTFQDGTQIALATHRSNLFLTGGPWQATIDGRRYLQYSSEVLLIMAQAFDVLDLPLGRPEGAACSGLERSLLDLAFP